MPGLAIPGLGAQGPTIETTAIAAALDHSLRARDAMRSILDDLDSPGRDENEDAMKRARAANFLADLMRGEK